MTEDGYPAKLEAATIELKFAQVFVLELYKSHLFPLKTKASVQTLLQKHLGTSAAVAPDSFSFHFGSSLWRLLIKRVFPSDSHLPFPFK